MGGMHTEAIFGAGGIWKLCFPARAWYYYTKMKSKAESHANAHTVHAKDTHNSDKNWSANYHVVSISEPGPHKARCHRIVKIFAKFLYKVHFVNA